MSEPTKTAGSLWYFMGREYAVYTWYVNHVAFQL
jgi:hypothetical protein